MLDYETCKKLKDCGFPNPLIVRKNHCYGFIEGEEGKFYSPSLSELIEACGKGFVMWSYHDKWVAGWTKAEDIGRCSYRYFDDSPQITSIGETPEEAVANLYIALNS